MGLARHRLVGIFMLLLASWLTMPLASSSSAAATPAATCATTQLRLHVGQSQAAAGNLGTPIIITNISAQRCTLQGYPTLTAHSAMPSPRPIHFIHRSQSMIYVAVASRLVTLAPKGTASFGLSYLDGLDQQYGTGKRCQMDAITVRLPGATPPFTSVVPLTRKTTDGYGPINACFTGFVLGVTPIVAGSQPPQH